MRVRAEPKQVSTPTGGFPLSNADLRDLVPMPSTTLELLALLDDPQADLRRLTAVAKRDVALSALLLRQANSPYFGIPGHVGNLSDAIKLIGTDQTRLVVLTSGIASLTQRRLAVYGLSKQVFMRHSADVAALTLTIAHRTHSTSTSYAYSAGLLHDVGKVVLNDLALAANSAGSVDNLFSAPSEQPLHDILADERQFFGTDHASIGQQIADMWRLPSTIGEAIGHHHDDHGGQEPELANFIAIANAIAAGADSAYPRSQQPPMPGDPIVPVDQLFTPGIMQSS